MNFIIRKIQDDVLPGNKRAIEEIIRITREQITDMDDSDFETIRRLFKYPHYKNLRHIFFTVEDNRRNIKGYAQLSHARDLNYCFLDIIAMSGKRSGGGLGSSLYERLREEALNLKSIGIFIECMADTPALLLNKKHLTQNRKRMKFYEEYNVRPIINTGYEELTSNKYGNTYHLLFDPLDRKIELNKKDISKIFRSLLTRNFNPPCGEKEIQKLQKSIKDEIIQFRKLFYTIKPKSYRIQGVSEDEKIPMVFNDLHIIHHIKERGYVESPVRVKRILSELSKTNLFRIVRTIKFKDSHIYSVHKKDFVDYFKRISKLIEPGKTLYPDVFPIRKDVRPPRKLITRAGYYCVDVYSPINNNSYLASRQAVNCALTAAEEVLNGSLIAYALVRPPGHHAESNSFGGFCYLNSTAIASHYLSQYGRVAILDIDYHHGNGQQEIFYERNDILTISIHADPDFEYPHFSGFSNEKGLNEGHGYNINYPLPEGVDGKKYNLILKKAIKNVTTYKPDFLVISLGFDSAKGDPTGTWLLEKEDFYNTGYKIGQLQYPTLLIQEGGYNNRVLGINARHFFSGLWKGFYNK